MISNDGYALLIGVDDYSSVGPGAALKGSREDVLKLYWFARALLGLPPQNIRVLASPPLTAAEFYMTSPPPAEMMGEATQASIQAGVAWLAGRMGADGAAPGLLTFSGHGSYSKTQGPLLCPADVGADLAKGIAVRDLSKMESLQAVRERLTVVLDCCHVVGDAPASNLRTSTALAHDATADAVAADHADFDISERVLLAARPGQSAYQALLGKVFHGALTFALVTVAEQWKASQEPGSPGMHVSYKQLLKRVRKLLWALRMKQNVHLRVPEAPMSRRKAVRKLPFFGTHAGVTVRGPDAERDRLQLDPNFYTISVGGNTIAVVVATGDPGSPDVYLPGVPGATTPGVLASPNTEYWYVNTSRTTGLGTLSSVTTSSTASITSTSIPTGSTQQSPVPVTSSCTYQFPSAEGASWTSDSPRAPGTGAPYYFKGVPAAAPTGFLHCYLLLNVTNTGGTNPTYSLNAVQWYITGLSTRPGSASGVLDPTCASYTYQDFPPRSYYGAASL